MPTNEQQNEDEKKFCELIELLIKIFQSDRPVGIRINFDGHKYTSWNLDVSNLKAADWNPTEQMKRLPAGITVERVTKMLHRKG